jgi:hypothetical protein
MWAQEARGLSPNMSEKQLGELYQPARRRNGIASKVRHPLFHTSGVLTHPSRDRVSRPGILIIRFTNQRLAF